MRSRRGEHAGGVGALRPPLLPADYEWRSATAAFTWLEHDVVEQVDAEDADVVRVLRVDAQRQAVVAAAVGGRDIGEPSREQRALPLDDAELRRDQVGEEVAQRRLDADLGPHAGGAGQRLTQRRDGLGAHHRAQLGARLAVGQNGTRLRSREVYCYCTVLCAPYSFWGHWQYLVHCPW